MVINFCGFRRRLRPNGSSEKALEKESNGLINKLMKVKRSGEKKQEVQLCLEKCKIITLEDLIISSPAHDCMNIGETPMHKQYSSSRKIHPSFDGDLKQPFLPISTSTNQPQINGEVEAGSSAFCRTKSAKSKKKVSFRSPEVADVFVLHHSPTS